MLKFLPVSLAVCSSAPKTPLVVLGVVSLISFFMPVLRFVIIWNVSGLSGGVYLICGYVRRPPMGGSATSNVMSGGISPSTTALAA